MQKIQFTKEEEAELVRHIQGYFETELEQDLGQLPAQFLLEFFSTKLGYYFYNRGLYDAQSLLKNRLDDISDEILSLEKSGLLRQGHSGPRTGKHQSTEIGRGINSCLI